MGWVMALQATNADCSAARPCRTPASCAEDPQQVGLDRWPIVIESSEKSMLQGCRWRRRAGRCRQRQKAICRQTQQRARTQATVNDQVCQLCTDGK